MSSDRQRQPRAGGEWGCPAGCSVEQVDEARASEAVAWVTGSKADPATASGRWALLHCLDGVVWGRLEDGGWVLGPARDGPLAAGPESILELRIFGETSEILLWREEMGLGESRLRGRSLTDAATPDAEALRPHDDRRLLVGDHIEKHLGNGFALVADARGRRQVLPGYADRRGRIASVEQGVLPLALEVRHYFARERSTGAVRVVASRLVEIRERDHDRSAAEE